MEPPRLGNARPFLLRESNAGNGERLPVSEDIGGTPESGGSTSSSNSLDLLSPPIPSYFNARSAFKVQDVLLL
eukprot:405590-Heterocapsa_arctica.AAC.1